MMTKKKWKVLISAPYFQPVVSEYASFFDSKGIELVVPPVRERLSEEELLECIGDIDGMICGDDRVTERVLDAAPKLKVISKWGTGIDSIDRAAAERRGIHIKNTPNAFTDAVADTAMAFILSFARQIPWTDRDIRSGIWEKRRGRTLRESVLGIIGVGNCGKAVVRRARAFGMRVLGYDCVPIAESFIHETGIEVVSFSDLLSRADFVTLHCDLNPTSRHCMSDDQFALMRPTAYIINTARGPLVDEVALVRALVSERIAGAGLDVFEHEPLPADSPLRGMDNVLMSPHNANASPAAWERVHENTVKNLIDTLQQYAGDQ